MLRPMRKTSLALALWASAALGAPWTRPDVEQLKRVERPRLAALWARTWRRDRNEDVVFVPAWGRMVTSLTSDHGSPWAYDAHTPLILWGPGHVRPGDYLEMVRAVDLMPTLSALLGRPPDVTLPGRVLEDALVPGAPLPRAVISVVLDQVGFDALAQDLADLPTLSRLAREGAWFRDCRVDYLPTITALFHEVLGSGRYAVQNGISSDKLWDPQTRKYRNAVDDGDPAPIQVPTLMELWQREQGGRPRIVALAGVPRTTVELAGHRGAEPADNLKAVAWWDTERERWVSNPAYYRLPPEAACVTFRTVFRELPADWLGHRLDTPEARYRSPLMASVVAEALVRIIETERIGGAGGPADLLHVTFKDTDTAGHDHGNGSPEFRTALRAADRGLGRVLAALERQAGRDGLVVLVTADHGGMPEKLRQAGARVTEKEMARWLLERLPVKPGASPWLRDVVNPQVYLIPDGMKANGYTPELVARTLEQHPAIEAAFTGTELEALRARSAAR